MNSSAKEQKYQITKSNFLIKPKHLKSKFQTAKKPTFVPVQFFYDLEFT
jgi:hypothetical protein